MVIFSVFWLSLFVILFFILGILFKSMSAFLEAIGIGLARSLVAVIVVALIMGFLAGVFMIVFWAEEGTLKDNLIGLAVIVAIGGGIVAVAVEFGVVALEFVVIIVGGLVTAIMIASRFLGDFFENCLDSCMNRLVATLEKV